MENILRNAWLIAAVALVTALLGILAALSVTPVYESNTLIQINRNAPLSQDLQNDVPAATEVEILRSRSIVTRVVKALELDLSVEPQYFPVIGAYLARADRSLPAFLEQRGYAWGADRVNVTVFDVPDRLLRLPFTLEATTGGGFVLTQKDLGIRVAGRVGQPLRLPTRHGDVEVLVSAVNARPGARFVVTRNPVFQVVEQLRKSLNVTESSKESNVIGVSLKGSRPELISRILNQIGNEYVSQHIAQKTAETSRALVFYDQQLAESRQRMQKLDDRLAQVLRALGVADLNEENATLSQQSIALQTRLAEAEQQKLELSSRFLDQHPAVIVAERHIQDVTGDLHRIEARRRALAAAQQEIARLTRDRQANSEVNLGLLNSRQKLAALMSSENRDVRVVDRAETPLQPATLRLPVMIALACLAGLLAGVAASVAKNAIVARNSGVTVLYMRDVSEREETSVGG
jgi:tyrosine-protein kinase Etk/Wzc